MARRSRSDASGSVPGRRRAFVRSEPDDRALGGCVRTAEVTALTAVGLYKIVVGQLDRTNIGGPIQIAVAAGEQARQGFRAWRSSPR